MSDDPIDFSEMSDDQIEVFMNRAMRSYDAARAELLARVERTLAAAYGHELRLIDDVWCGTVGRWPGSFEIIWCFYCGERPGWQREHRIPKSRGGSNDKSNIARSCATCNNRKGTMTVEEYRAALERRTGQPHTFFGERK